MLHLYHVWYWEQSSNPCVSFLKNSPMNFVEEDGEISLALLAHNYARHSIKFDHKSLSDLYQLIGLYRDTCFDTMSDLGLNFNKQKHTAVKVTDNPIKTIVKHFFNCYSRLTELQLVSLLCFANKATHDSSS